MVAFVSNPPAGPRLYALIQPVDVGGGNPAQARIVDAAWNSLTTFLARGFGGALNPDPWSYDKLRDAGVKWFAFPRMFGSVTPAYKIGRTPASYPGGAFDIKCEPENQVRHLANYGNSFLSQIVPAFDLAARKGRAYGYVFGGGAMDVTSATTNPVIDAHTAIAESLGAIPQFDSARENDYTDAANPQKKLLDRAFSARGVRCILESFGRRDVPEIQGNLTHAYGVNADTSGGRPQLAIANPLLWDTLDSVGAVRRAAIVIQADGPSVAARFASMRYWMNLGYDVWLDFAGFSFELIAEAVKYAASVIQRGRGQTRRLQTRIAGTGSNPAAVAKQIGDIGSVVGWTPTLSIASDAEGVTAADTRRFTISVVDMLKQKWTGRWLVRVYIAPTELGDPDATGNTVVFVTGTVQTTSIPNASYTVLSDADGKITLDLTVAGAASRFVYGAVVAQMQSSGELTYA